MNLPTARHAYTALRQARAQLELDYRAGAIGLDRLCIEPDDHCFVCKERTMGDKAHGDGCALVALRAALEQAGVSVDG